jgi:hypothetical protein
MLRVTLKDMSWLEINGFWYLGSPYSKFPGGMDEASREVSRLAGEMILAGIPVFAPISHSHAIAEASRIDPASHTIWLPADQPFIDKAHGMVVAMMEGWRDSIGVKHEMDCFRMTERPILFLDPETLTISDQAHK